MKFSIEPIKKSIAAHGHFNELVSGTKTPNSPPRGGKNMGVGDHGN